MQYEVLQIQSEELAKIALHARYQNLMSIRKAKCISIREYRTIKNEVSKLEEFLLFKRKERANCV